MVGPVPAVFALLAIWIPIASTTLAGGLSISCDGGLSLPAGGALRHSIEPGSALEADCAYAATPRLEIVLGVGRQRCEAASEYYDPGLAGVDVATDGRVTILQAHGGGRYLLSDRQHAPYLELTVGIFQAERDGTVALRAGDLVNHENLDGESDPALGIGIGLGYRVRTGEGIELFAVVRWTRIAFDSEEVGAAGASHFLGLSGGMTLVFGGES